MSQKLDLVKAWKDRHPNIPGDFYDVEFILKWLTEQQAILDRDYMKRPDYEKAEFDVYNIISVLTGGNSQKAKHGAGKILQALNIGKGE